MKSTKTNQVTLTSLVELRLPPVRSHENFVLGCESVRCCVHALPFWRSTERNVPSKCRLFYVGSGSASYQNLCRTATHPRVCALELGEHSLAGGVRGRKRLDQNVAKLLAAWRAVQYDTSLLKRTSSQRGRMGGVVVTDRKRQRAVGLVGRSRRIHRLRARRCLTKVRRELGVDVGKRGEGVCRAVGKTEACGS